MELDLGTVSRCLGEYVKVKKYLKKALAIMIGRGDRQGESSCQGILGQVHISVGEYDMARLCLEKALAMKVQIGDRKRRNIGLSTLGNFVDNDC